MTQTLKTLLGTAAFACAVASGAHSVSAGDLKIGHPWARATVPGQPAGGAFLSVHNSGTTPDRLVGATTPAAAHVQLHEMRMDGDVMRMREVPALEVAPGQTLKLEPGRMHLMLLGLKQPLKADARVPLTLKFERAGDVKVEMKIESAVPGRPASQSHAH